MLRSEQVVCHSFMGVKICGVAASGARVSQLRNTIGQRGEWVCRGGAMGRLPRSFRPLRAVPQTSA
jgi:hypothetical protein